MATSRPFTYNSNSLIPGTEKFGGLTVGYPTSGFESTGLQWWNGPDEDLGYVIATTMVDSNGNGTQPTSIPGVFGNVGFNRTKTWMYSEFIDLVNTRYNQSFTGVTDAKLWLESNGKWTSFVDSTGNTINNFIDRVEYNGGVVESESSLSSSVAEIGEDLFNQASLVITPNGYEQSLLFSLKPTNGSGDMVVSRATTATRVNEDGLIEQVPYNLSQRSEEFDNVWWVKALVDISPNVVISPNGLQNADAITPNTLFGNHWIGKTYNFNVGSVYTVSLFAKDNGYNLVISIGSNSNSCGCNFNLSLGTTSTPLTRGTANPCTASISDVGDGWYRCSITFTAWVGLSNNVLFSTNDTNITPNGPFGMANMTGDGVKGFYIWGAQLVQDSEPKPYFPTTDRLNVPRIDYTDGVGKLLVEPQRTNLITNSDGNLSTYPSNGNVTNATTPINGFANSIQFIQDGVTKHAYKNLTFTSGQTYTFSCFIEMDDGGVPVTTNSTDISSDFAIVMINSVRGEVSIKRLGNTNVYRVLCKDTLTGTNGSFGIAKYSTNSNRGFKVTGYQIEQGSNATSYIPTTSSTVTRNADVISKTGIGNLIGQTEGTIFIDFDLTRKITEDRRLFSLIGIGGIANNRLTMSGGDRYAVDFVYNGGFTQIFTNINQPLVAKLCVKYDNFSYKFFVNGVLINTNNSLTPLGLSELYLGSYGGAQSLNGFINKFLIFKTALTNQQCIDLTTL